MRKVYSMTSALLLRSGSHQFVAAIVAEPICFVQHIHSTNDEHKLLDKLEPTIALAVPNSTKLRFDRHGASGNVPEERWATLDGQWAAFAKRQGLGAPGKNCQAGVTGKWHDNLPKDPANSPQSAFGWTLPCKTRSLLRLSSPKYLWWSSKLPQTASPPKSRPSRRSFSHRKSSARSVQIYPR